MSGETNECDQRFSADKVGLDKTGRGSEGHSSCAIAWYTESSSSLLCCLSLQQLQSGFKNVWSIYFTNQKKTVWLATRRHEHGRGAVVIVVQRTLLSAAPCVALSVAFKSYIVDHVVVRPPRQTPVAGRPQRLLTVAFVRVCETVYRLSVSFAVVAAVVFLLLYRWLLFVQFSHF